MCKGWVHFISKPVGAVGIGRIHFDSTMVWGLVSVWERRFRTRVPIYYENCVCECVKGGFTVLHKLRVGCRCGGKGIVRMVFGRSVRFASLHKNVVECRFIAKKQRERRETLFSSFAWQVLPHGDATKQDTRKPLPSFETERECFHNSFFLSS